MDTFFLEKSTERVGVRISQRAKKLLSILSEIKGMNESQYVKLAIQNQIKCDEHLLPNPTEP
jgi:predicted DNA-binding protein